MKHSVIIKNLVLLSLIATSTQTAWSRVNTPGSYRIEMTMDEKSREALKAQQKTQATQIDLKVFKAGQLVDEGKVEVSSRGQSSIKYPRKNYGVKTLKESDGKKKSINVGDITSKNVIMSAGAMDNLFVKNSIGFSILRAIGIHSLQTQFAELEINGQSQGLYMLTENQAVNLMKEKDAEIVFRRRYNDDLEVKEAKEGLSQAQIAKYQDTLRSVHRSIRDLEGDELIATLQKNLNLKNYLKWLAFNYIVKNGDYSDEVYFYGKTDQATGEIVFDVSPWDMDDSFSDTMHLSGLHTGANHHREEDSKKQLIYNYESRIDRKVAGDEKLLRMYFQAMGEVIDTLSQGQTLQRIEDSIIKDLNPYLDDVDVQENGLLDEAKARHSRAAIESEVKEKIAQVRENMQMVKTELNAISTEESIRGRVLDLSGFRKVLIKINNSLLRRFTK